MTKTWSPDQQAIFDFVTDPAAGSAIVEAVAGSGKTTTIVEAVSRLQRKSYIFLAFNKAIATELGERGVLAKTFHSLTFNPVLRIKKARAVDSNKLRILCDVNLAYDDRRMYSAFICKLVSLAKQMGVGVLVPDEVEVWDELVAHHNLELESEKADIDDAVDLSRSILRLSNESPIVDFDDLLYLAVKEKVALPKFDFVFVDEAQDTNAIQRALIRKLMHDKSRLVAVGDPAQAIYGFRGADSESISMLAQEFSATRLPLSVSYRCPKAVVSYARQWVSHIQPAEGAVDGTVTELGETWEPKLFKRGDLVVCRRSAPLLSLAYSMLRQQLPVTVMGRDIGEGLITLVKKMGARSVERLQVNLEKYREREVSKATKQKNEARADTISDRCEAILVLIDSLPEASRTVPELINVIERLFADKAGAVVLATIHKSKGLEADNVYWLNRSECPSRWAKQDWQKAQEANLCYVATTRAKKTLTIIEAKKNRKQQGAW